MKLTGVATYEGVCAYIDRMMEAKGLCAKLDSWFTLDDVFATVFAIEAAVAGGETPYLWTSH